MDRSNRGYSLLELIAVMGMSSILALTSATSIELLAKSNRRQSERVTFTQQTQLLELLLRPSQACRVLLSGITYNPGQSLSAPLELSALQRNLSGAYARVPGRVLAAEGKRVPGSPRLEWKTVRLGKAESDLSEPVSYRRRYLSPLVLEAREAVPPATAPLAAQISLSIGGRVQGDGRTILIDDCSLGGVAEVSRGVLCGAGQSVVGVDPRSGPICGLLPPTNQGAGGNGLLDNDEAPEPGQEAAICNPRCQGGVQNAFLLQGISCRNPDFRCQFYPVRPGSPRSGWVAELVNPLGVGKAIRRSVAACGNSVGGRFDFQCDSVLVTASSESSPGRPGPGRPPLVLTASQEFPSSLISSSNASATCLDQAIDSGNAHSPSLGASCRRVSEISVRPSSSSRDSGGDSVVILDSKDPSLLTPGTCFHCSGSNCPGGDAGWLVTSGSASPQSGVRAHSCPEGLAVLSYQ